MGRRLSEEQGVKKSATRRAARRTPAQRAAYEAMLHKAAGSCLDANDVQQLGFVPMTEEESKALKLSRAGAGFKIPYFDINGTELPMFRYRYFETSSATGFLAGVEHRKYDQPAGTPPEVYFPRLNGVDWLAIEKDITKPLCVTEGELKPACATKHGHPTIGLGGVWSFQRKKRDIKLLPALEEIVWTDRRVDVVFDSDYRTNLHIMQALHRLATELTERGAKVYVVDLPADDTAEVAHA